MNDEFDDGPTIDAATVETALIEVLSEDVQEAFGDDAAELVHLESFADAGLVTRDNGLVLRFADGSEFQVTIVRSR